ncbi:polyubiquitin-B-like isoform X1 [Montipora foliosa]|uniref:polyubiquitin-B-like isoform X1 n=1 Tax=Montipora foliosa TaxID=591990 RepID=UPI0035F1A838
MAQKYLVTKELLEEFGLLEVKLTTFIPEEEYRACQEYFSGRRREKSQSGTQLIDEQGNLSEKLKMMKMSAATTMESNLEVSKAVDLSRQQKDVDWVAGLADYSPVWEGDKTKQLSEEDFTQSRGNIPTTATRPLGLSEKMQILVDPFIGEKFYLEVGPSDSVEKVKTKILEKKGIPADQQVLVFKGELLKDERTLSDYHIDKESTPYLRFRYHDDVTVFVRGITRSTFSLRVRTSDSVESLKRKIMVEEDIPVHDQRLLYSGRQLEDGCTLTDCRITEGSTVDLVSRLRGGGEMAIFAKLLNGKLLRLGVEPDDLIENVKVKIQDEVGISSDKQELFCDGRKLKNGRTLRHYNIQHDFTLTVVSESVMEIYVRFSSAGETITLTIRSSDAIRDLKNKIQAQQGIVAKKQILMFNSEELKDSCSVADYNIQNGSFLSLVFRESDRDGKCVLS